MGIKGLKNNLEKHCSKSSRSIEISSQVGKLYSNLKALKLFMVKRSSRVVYDSLNDKKGSRREGIPALILI